MKSFTVWLEMLDAIEQSILGVVSGDNPVTSGSEREHLLQRKTTEFSRHIIDRLRNLGVIQNIANEDLQRYSDIIKAIDKGVTIQELVQMIRLGG